MRPFVGPPLPRLKQRDALRRAAACERPRAAQRKNVGPSEFLVIEAKQRYHRNRAFRPWRAQTGQFIVRLRRT